MPERKILIFKASWCGWCKRLEDNTIPLIQEGVTNGKLILIDTDDKSAMAEYQQFKHEGGVPQTVIIEQQANGKWQEIFFKIGYYDDANIVLKPYNSGMHQVKARGGHTGQDGLIYRAMDRQTAPVLGYMGRRPPTNTMPSMPAMPSMPPISAQYAAHYNANNLHSHQYATQGSYRGNLYHGQSAMHGSRHNDNCLCNHAYYGAYSRCQ